MCKTQKARGLQKLHECDLYTGEFRILENAELHGNPQIRSFPKFFRPCPLRPRHGFVNSRVCATPTELQDLVRETLEQDDQAEMIVMPLIDAEKSAVVTRCGMTVGSGSDGATAGSADTIYWPIMSDLTRLKNACEITQDLFLETLQTMPKYIYYVQARDGVLPTNLRSDAWIPADQIVSNVIDVAEYDDAGPDYEGAIADAPAGSVLIHRGGTMLSHWAQHAIVRQMPIIFDDRAISIGDHVIANVAITEYPDQRAALMQGIQLGMTANLNQRHSEVMQIVLVTIHNAMQMRQTAHGSAMLGFAVAALLRYAYAAICGEIRHLRKRDKPDRDQIFQHTLANFDAFLECRKKITDSRNKFFDRPWKSGYGGDKWGKCSNAAKHLEHALLQVCREKSYGQQAIDDLILRAHTVVNCAHNNGPFLNKFAPSNMFDNAACGQYSWVIKSGYRIHEFYLHNFANKTYEIKLAPWIHCKVQLNRREKNRNFDFANQRLQFRFRNQLLHFQYGSMSKYKSCTFDPASFCDQDKTFLDQEITLTLVESLANTSRRYRQLCQTTFEMLSPQLQQFLITNLI